MGTTTPGVLPYPEPTDSVAAGADAIKSLATKTDTLLPHTFPTVAARDAWANPPRGAICVTTDTDTAWQRGASSWVRLITAGSNNQMQFGSSGVSTDANACVWVTLNYPYANNGYRVFMTPVSLGTATTAAQFVLVVVNSQVFADRFLVRMFTGAGTAAPSAVCNFFWMAYGTPT